MSTTELAALVHRTCFVPLGKMQVRCKITDARAQYGNDRVLVQPVAGVGETWRNLDTVRVLPPTPQAESHPEAKTK